MVVIAATLIALFKMNVHAYKYTCTHVHVHGYRLLHVHTAHFTQVKGETLTSSIRVCVSERGLAYNIGFGAGDWLFSSYAAKTD